MGFPARQGRCGGEEDAYNCASNTRGLRQRDRGRVAGTLAGLGTPLDYKRSSHGLEPEELVRLCVLSFRQNDKKHALLARLLHDLQSVARRGGGQYSV